MARWPSGAYADLDQKWLRGVPPVGEGLVGSADIQSLADMGNSYELVRGMRLTPITRETIFQLSALTLLPNYCHYF